MPLPTDREIDLALLEAQLRHRGRSMVEDAIRAAAKILQARAIEISKRRAREAELEDITQERLAELRKQEWIERLERERGLRGRAHPPRLEPKEDEDARRDPE